MSSQALIAVANMADFPLENTTRLVLYALAHRHNWFTGDCYPSFTRLARDAGVSKNSVARAIDSLTANGYLKVVPNDGQSSGGRKSDRYVFLFPVPDLTPGPKKSTMETARDGFVPISTDFVPTTGNFGATMGTEQDSNRSKNIDSVGENASDTVVDISAAVDLLWKSASDAGRQRSSKGDIETALKAAVKRGPGTPPERMERIMRGMGAWFRSAEATKDDGSFQAGIHRKIVKDRWAGYLDDEEARVSAGGNVSPAAQQAAQTMGTIDAPSEARQKLWMELFSQGMPWDSERGPQPGRLGCRVAPEIQRAFGTEPYAPPVDEDAAAFN